MEHKQYNLIVKSKQLDEADFEILKEGTFLFGYTIEDEEYFFTRFKKIRKGLFTGNKIVVGKICNEEKSYRLDEHIFFKPIFDIKGKVDEKHRAEETPTSKM